MTGLNPWHRGVVFAFDTETTGVDVTRDRIVTACIVRIDPTEQSVREKNWLLNPGIPIPDGAAKIHGVTTEKAQAEGADPKVALLEIVSTLRQAWLGGIPIVGHNVVYDIAILDHELARHGLGTVHSHEGPGYLIDTLALDRMLRPNWRGKRKLTDCCEAYSVRIDAAHQANYDAIAAARIAWRMAEGFPSYIQLDLHELQDRQRSAHRAWAEEFGAYLRSAGKHDDVVRDWPHPAVDSRAQVPA